MLLEARNIHKSYPAAAGLFGPSGCGKTTLALVLAGIIACDRGSVSLEGKEVWRGGRQDFLAAHRRIQLVTQHPETAFDPPTAGYCPRLNWRNCWKNFN